jgi:uncharacterized ParB-like nuclease family protein
MLMASLKSPSPTPSTPLHYVSTTTTTNTPSFILGATITYEQGVFYAFEGCTRFNEITAALDRNGLLLWKDSVHQRIVVVPDPLTDEILEKV